MVLNGYRILKKDGESIMHYGKIGTEYKYDMTEHKFQIAFSFLKREDLASLPEGWIELGDGVRASVQHYSTMDAKTLDFETHEKYFDVQYLVEGEELLGVCSRKGLTEKIPYAQENDVTFYHEPALSGSVLLYGGDYVVFAPEDAHKPRCAAGAAMPVKKIVIKVPV